MMNFEHYAIPEYMQSGLERYVESHIAPGDFLQAVICNDLRLAAIRADDVNILLLGEYVKWLYNETPIECWGNPEKYKAWVDRAGGP
jgi:hypothetical protein